ncbi:MAG: type II 3-dehydroquinate dehydratase [Truepera sp.]|nr:type II 3-dehydroquinate dehydratase [Truepera sp.]
MILVLNGPNLNLLGLREPEVYGEGTLEELEAKCEAWGEDLGLTVVSRQSNFEGQLIDWLHRAESDGFRAVILNAGGLTHTSVPLRDAIAGIDIPVVEVHLSNVHAREPFRHRSLISAVCLGTIAGFGPTSYQAALLTLSERVDTPCQ